MLKLAQSPDEVKENIRAYLHKREQEKIRACLSYVIKSVFIYHCFY